VYSTVCTESLYKTDTLRLQRVKEAYTEHIPKLRHCPICNIQTQKLASHRHSGPLECHAGLTGKQLLTLQRRIAPSSSGSNSPTGLTAWQDMGILYRYIRQGRWKEDWNGKPLLVVVICTWQRLSICAWMSVAHPGGQMWRLRYTIKLWCMGG
jgi:hypothetical protein